MKVFISTLIISLLLSCNNKATDYDFQKQIAKFDKTIKKHFPNKLVGLYTSSVFNDTYHDVTSIILLNQFDNEKLFNKIKDSLINLSIAKYTPRDSCLLVVNMFTKENNYFNSFKTNDTSYLKKNCLKNKLPIPNFWSLDFRSKNITHLPQDYNIFVFEASHNIIDKKYISENVYMPSYWKHGYSKGVAINNKEKKIIYWFVLW